MDATNDINLQGVAQEKTDANNASSHIDSQLQDDAVLQGLQELMDKVGPLLAGGRFGRIVDLLSVTADVVDMSDAYMVEKLANAFEDVVGAARTTGNAARMARQQVSSMQETPS